MVMTLSDGMAFFLDSSGIGSEEIETKIVIFNLLVLLIVLLWNISLFIFVEVLAD